MSLEARSLRKSFGGLTATDNLSLEATRGEIHAVIGPNGAGKTTLVHLLSGLLKPDAGEIMFEGRDITRLSAPARVNQGLARSFQITSIFREFTVLENVMLSVQAGQGHSFRFWRPAAKDESLRAPARELLERVGLGGRMDVKAGNLAHGEQRQLEIAISLATGPSFLLLDEPMAGMGLEESQVMIDFLKALKGDYTMLLIEHDMDAVFALADRITVLVYGRAIATGTPDEIRNDASVRAAYLGDEASGGTV
ncbi:MAG: ABC transporter ATP-binding protein [Rhodospirillaceae bacterium]|nr:ABC transporter ATP-binding protein [Rhodospirillaceae bacterium]MBT3810519.1 ABC transporter ATP-binding protein [Rhodospirillaceae bacterium]MBT3930468.1 ABC transporter ATP-binding protein [Rhodospirillaceae bacterium]MBT4772198.1 ABC transporter ATP-binding protein [Rhodospirillaceae bacterium]MBT5359485.1 ABC transporter ATP-binding protein [Rhodospirillaceae bacterium]